MTNYDEIPYDSTPFSQTHPANLAIMGRLFGMQPVPAERARVLELGCATGGNIIPMAWRLPDSRFVGIELSGGQVEVGQKLVARLGLKNIEIRQADIMDLGPELGRFDYILVHGVYSWVPEAVREQIMRICSQNLGEQGIAYVSYNTLPGWRMRGMLRDMLLHHVRNHATPQMRLAHAYELLDFLDTALDGQETAHAVYLKHEIDGLRKRHPSYVYHEYLEEINQPFLFSEFAAHAGQHKLQYVCEADLDTMFPDTLGEAAAPLLERFEDAIEQEQYMDFLRNRNFRKTLLCHENLQIDRDLELEEFARSAFYACLSPAEDLDLRTVSAQTFVTPDAHAFVVSHPLTKAAVGYLNDNYPDAVGFDTLAHEAKRRLTQARNTLHIEQTDHLLGELVGLYLRQAIGLAEAPERLFRSLAERPRMNDLARAQTEFGLGHVATARHATIELDAFAARVIQYLDGSRTRAQLIKQLVADIAEKRLQIDAGVTGDRNALTRMVSANCDRLLAVFARHGVLAA